MVEDEADGSVRAIVYCRRGKHRSRASALLLEHLLTACQATVTVQHLSVHQAIVPKP